MAKMVLLLTYSTLLFVSGCLGFRTNAHNRASKSVIYSEAGRLETNWDRWWAPEREQANPKVYNDAFLDGPGTTLSSSSNTPSFKSLSQNTFIRSVDERGDIQSTTATSYQPGTTDSYTYTNTVSPCAIVFRTSIEMYQSSDNVQVGTIAFIRSQEIVFIRVLKGWKQLETCQPTKHTPSLFHSSAIHVEGPSLRLVALNDPMSGNMQGLRGADYSCYHQARRANLEGTFRAFLTGWVQSLDSIVKPSDRNLPVINIKGELIFKKWLDVFNSSGRFLQYLPKLLSFNGRNVFEDLHWPQKNIWHGAHSTGFREPRKFCDNWYSDSVSEKAQASNFNNGVLIGNDEIGCDQKLIVLCIEIQALSEQKENSYIEKYNHISTVPMTSPASAISTVPMSSTVSAISTKSETSTATSSY